MNELEEKITYLIQNESIRKEIAEKGFDFVQRFNDDKIAINVNQLYINTINAD